MTSAPADPRSAGTPAIGAGTEARAPEMPPYDPEQFWDEMFAGPGQVRPHYAELARQLATLGPADVARRQRAADHSFQARGITFAVNQGVEGIEKIMPFDLVPRMITPDEWRQIERGLEQRVRALNLFLHDLYHEQRILEQRGGAAGAGAGRHAATGASSGAWTCRSGSTPTSSAATWSATRRARSSCWRTTCGRRRASRTWSRTGGS